MKKTKITPEDRLKIVTRVKAGEKQSDLAKEYDVSKGYISQISRNRQKPTEAANRSLETVPLENLRNRYYELAREIAEIHTEKDDRRMEAFRLRERLKRDTERMQKTDDSDERKVLENTLNAHRSQFSWTENHTRLDLQLLERLSEQLAISKEFIRRSQPIPTKGVSP